MQSLPNWQRSSRSRSRSLAQTGEVIATVQAMIRMLREGLTLHELATCSDNLWTRPSRRGPETTNALTDDAQPFIVAT
jgi:hypothetical protein